MESPEPYGLATRTDVERQLSGKLYLLEICMQQLVRDQDVLQERMDKLERQMRFIMLRLPVGIANPGRNKYTLKQPVALETLDD
eukprot:s2209_g3.t1